ncbi:MAG: hypothetical protein F6J87_25265 [Spirulina sp. SIO3F2]|nr:hypothetical protein [Spirulina sp. SIO3F2]
MQSPEAKRSGIAIADHPIQLALSGSALSRAHYQFMGLQKPSGISENMSAPT